MERNDLEHNPIVAYVECPHCENVAMYVRYSAFKKKKEGQVFNHSDFCDLDENIMIGIDYPRVCMSCGTQDFLIMERVERLNVVKNKAWFKKHPELAKEIE